MIKFHVNFETPVSPMKTPAGTEAANTVNGRPSFAMDRRFGPRVSAGGFLAGLGAYAGRYTSC